MTDPYIGQTLSNRYQLIELIGRGAMGRVYRADDILLGGVTVAVKFLSQTLLNRKMRDRFKIEAKTCAQLGQKSIHIVRVMDYGVNNEDVPYYVMEYLQGNSLSEIISTQSLSLPRFLSFARQICLGLQCAHQGIIIDGTVCPIIHRDIKPSNVLVSDDASLGELLKILDFGISKLLQSDSGQTNSYMGTLAYSSPEQMEGRELDPRSDVYSLGVMMYEMLTGKMPVQAETHSFGGWYKAHHFQPPRSFETTSPNLKIPRVLESLVINCLAKSPADRPQSVGEVLRALEPLEQRYTANRQISHRIREVLDKRPPAADPRHNQPKTEEVCRNYSWPKDKPVAQIVFPQAVRNNDLTLATLWVMLPQREIENIQINKLYNRLYKNFLCTMSPHPMVLWITAVYNQSYHQESGPRWLRCYLDLKTGQGQEITRLLAEHGQYQILFFALENPQQCAYLTTITLKDTQQVQLREWSITGQTWVSVSKPSMSKDLLQTEFEKVKPRIASEMEAHSTNYPSVNLSFGAD